MNRRNFLKKSLITSAVVGTAVSTSTSLTKEETSHVCHVGLIICKEHFLGYHLTWTGWKRATGCNLVAAQWVAYPINKEDKSLPNFYASVPGAEGTFQKGDTFDLTRQFYHPIEVLDCTLPDEEIIKQPWAIQTKSDTNQRLKNFMYRELTRRRELANKTP